MQLVRNSPALDANLGYFLTRAVRNENLAKRTRIFGREFPYAYNVAVEMHRETRERRESGHPSIVHTVEVALGMLGYANSYVLKSENMSATSKALVTPYDIIQYKKMIGVEDFEPLCLCTGVLHDSLEDTSKNPDEIERNTEHLLKALRPIEEKFAEAVVRNVHVLTNMYSILLKLAQKSIPSDCTGDKPFIAVEQGLNRLYDSLAKKPEYSKVVTMLLSDVDNLMKKGKKLEGDERRYFHAQTSTIAGVVDNLSYAAYNRYMLDVLRDAQKRFQDGDMSFEVGILVKRQDAFHNIETMNLSTRRKIRRALAKTEIVQRMIENENLGLEDTVIGRGEMMLGLVQHLRQNDAPEDYVELLEALALELRCLMIRACVKRIEALKQMDSHSVVAEMAPFLRRLEEKYREMYSIQEDEPVCLIRKNPLANLWLGVK